MANLSQAIANVHRYGLYGALKGAVQTPGGILGQPVQTQPGQTDYPVSNQRAPLQQTLIGGSIFDQNSNWPYGPTKPSTGQSGFIGPTQPSSTSPTSSATQLSSPMSQTTGGTGTMTNSTGSSGTGSQTFAPVVFMGQTYDPNTPEGRSALVEAQLGFASEQANTNKTALQRALDLYSTNFNTQFGADNTGGQFGDTLKRSLQQNDQNYQQGNLGQANYYSALGPIYQSSEGTAQAGRDKLYQQGTSDINQYGTNVRTQAGQERTSRTQSGQDQMSALEQALLQTQDAIHNNANQMQFDVSNQNAIANSLATPGISDSIGVDTSGTPNGQNLAFNQQPNSLDFLNFKASAGAGQNGLPENPILAYLNYLKTGQVGG